MPVTSGPRASPMDIDSPLNESYHDTRAPIGNLPLELIDLVIESIDKDDLASLANCALANGHCLRSARKRIFSRPFTLDSPERCLFLKEIITRTPIVARSIDHLKINGGYIPDCVSEHGDLVGEEEDDDVLEARQLWLNQACPVWRELPCVQNLDVSFLSAVFLAQCEFSLEDFALESVENLDLFHIEFQSPLHFQSFISRFKNLRHLTLSRNNNEDPKEALVVENMPPLRFPEAPLPPPPLSKLTLRSTSYLEDWRPVNEWLVSQTFGAQLRELWYLYDDNFYYKCYLSDIILAASHSLERLSLGFVWEGLWADNRNGPDELARFDSDLSTIRLPRLQYLCLFGDLSVRSVMSILSLAPPTLDELVFKCGTSPSYSWIHESSVAVVWQELLRPRFSGLKKLVFHLWGKMPSVEVAKNLVREKLMSKRGSILEFTQGEVVFNSSDVAVAVLPMNQHMLE